MSLVEDLAEKFRAENFWVSPQHEVRAECAAYFLGIKPKTLRNRTSLGTAPVSHKFGGKRRMYSIESLLEFKNQCAANSDAVHTGRRQKQLEHTSTVIRKAG